MFFLFGLIAYSENKRIWNVSQAESEAEARVLSIGSQNHIVCFGMKYSFFMP